MNWHKAHGPYFVPPPCLRSMGFTDRSEPNDCCARFSYGRFDENANGWPIEVWVDHIDERKRDVPGPRYLVDVRNAEGIPDVRLHTDSCEELENTLVCLIDDYQVRVRDAECDSEREEQALLQYRYE